MQSSHVKPSHIDGWYQIIVPEHVYVFLIDISVSNLFSSIKLYLNSGCLQQSFL